MSRTLLAAAVMGTVAFAGVAPAAEPLKVAKVEFTATPVPVTDVDMAVGHSKSSAILTLTDGTTRTIPFAPDVIWNSGQRIGGRQVGVVVDKFGKPMPRSAPDKKGLVAKGPFVSPGQDANSLLVGPDGKLRLVTHLEYVAEAPNVEEGRPLVNTYGLLPAMMHVTELAQDPKTGTLTAIKVANVDAGAVGGIWIPCNGSTTPWMTHLGSEEYEPNARYYETRPLEPMNLYLGTSGKLSSQGGANPYAYGHPVEVSIGKDGKAKAVKHYAMGRIALEMFEIMPDKRTAYAGDDGRDTMMLMFVADRAADLTAGTLYGAKWEQTSAADGGAATLSWIRLGHATEAEIAKLIARHIKFSDIFEVAAAPAEGFTPVFVYPGYDVEGGKQTLEYLKVKPGMEKAAAFLETRRYAAMQGATTEFTKMEGIALDPQGKTLFTAMSYMEQGMLEGKNDKRPNDHVRLAGDPADLVCGAVYATRLAGGARDTGGAAIASDWVGTSVKALVTGAKKPKDQTAYGALDKCDTDKVANPDNLSFSPAMRTLFIGEDSGNHLNNFVWAYGVDDGKLARIFSAPAGAENTGLRIVENAKGFAYLLGNIQHPGAEEDLSSYPAEIRAKFRTMVDKRGTTGVLAILPAMTR
ncbi:PhoX family protein [Paramagnetospirillum kuznetsovii]|nr:alkaline phosphatase PhoX [Paramagnetospirillum kuznetsovii]